MFSDGWDGTFVTKACLPTGFGILLIVVALLLGVRTRAFVGRATAVPGVVERLNAGGSHPEIQFATPAGDRVSYPQGGLIFGYKPGQTVRVLFEAHDPQGTAQIDAIGALYFGSIVLSFMGLIAILVGVQEMTTYLSHRK